MPVEDTDFSPPATAVMFLLTIHPTALEAGDFLSTDVKLSFSITQNQGFEYSFFYFWLHHFCSFFTMADGLLTVPSIGVPSFFCQARIVCGPI